MVKVVFINVDTTPSRFVVFVDWDNANRLAVAAQMPLPRRFGPWLANDHRFAGCFPFFVAVFDLKRAISQT